jgi:hypothetical protein
METLQIALNMPCKMARQSAIDLSTVKDNLDYKYRSAQQFKYQFYTILVMTLVFGN